MLGDFHLHRSDDLTAHGSALHLVPSLPLFKFTRLHFPLSIALWAPTLPSLVPRAFLLSSAPTQLTTHDAYLPCGGRPLSPERI